MKVLLDLQYLNVATTGIKTYMLELAKAARKYPHPEIDWIFTHDPEKQAAIKKSVGPQTKAQKLKYHLDYFRWKQIQLPALVKKYKPDVLVCLDFVSPAASLPCKRLTVIHDAFFWQIPENYPNWWRTYFLHLIRKGLRESTQLITTTAYSKNCLQQYLENSNPISVIYQTAKVISGPADEHFLQKSDLSKQGFFLHVGTFDRRKNLPLLVQAFAAYRRESSSPKKLVLAGGPGQNHHLNDLPEVNKLVAKLGLEKEVLLPGYLSDREIKALYEGAFAYVFPSTNEGFGIPLLEAMNFELPLIHSDQAALVEVAGGAGIPFQTSNVSDLTEKMILLEEDASLRSNLIHQGKERVKEFTAEKFITAFHRLILSA
jgi:glycosyltransferase involved in cell wall biosynthesis